MADRGGFGRGMGGDRGRGDRGRGDRGRGDRGRGRGPRRARGKKDEEEKWVPCTKLGRLVQQVIIGARSGSGREAVWAAVCMLWPPQQASLPAWRGRARSGASERSTAQERRRRLAVEQAVWRAGGVSPSVARCLQLAHRRVSTVLCAKCAVLTAWTRLPSPNDGRRPILRSVRQGKIKSLEQIYLFSMPVKEYQIVEAFLGSALKDEVMKIMPVQKQTRAGQRTRFKVGGSAGGGGGGAERGAP